MAFCSAAVFRVVPSPTAPYCLTSKAASADAGPATMAKVVANASTTGANANHRLFMAPMVHTGARAEKPPKTGGKGVGVRLQSNFGSSGKIDFK